MSSGTQQASSHAFSPLERSGETHPREPGSSATPPRAHPEPNGPDAPLSVRPLSGRLPESANGLLRSVRDPHGSEIRLDAAAIDDVVRAPSRWGLQVPEALLETTSAGRVVEGTRLLEANGPEVSRVLDAFERTIADPHHIEVHQGQGERFVEYTRFGEPFSDALVVLAHDDGSGPRFLAAFERDAESLPGRLRVLHDSYRLREPLPVREHPEPNGPDRLQRTVELDGVGRDARASTPSEPVTVESGSRSTGRDYSSGTSDGYSSDASSGASEWPGVFRMSPDPKPEGGRTESGGGPGSAHESASDGGFPDGDSSDGHSSDGHP
jgi:hypothetical protein